MISYSQCANVFDIFVFSNNDKSQLSMKEKIHRMQSPKFFLKVSKSISVPFVISLIFKQSRCSTCVLNKIQICEYFSQTIRVHKTYIRVHIEKLVITRQVLYCSTQILRF